MFRTNELKGIKNAYCRARRFQIVDRFMVEEYEYKGIASAKRRWMTSTPKLSAYY